MFDFRYRLVQFQIQRKLNILKRTLRYIGSNVNIKPDLNVRNPSFISIGDDVAIDEGAKLFVWDSYKRANQCFQPSLTIESGTHISRNLTIQCAGTLIIGKNALIASNVFITDFNHGCNPSQDCYINQPLLVKNVTISDNVWIGQNAIILPGVNIGAHSIIGAGSVVTKSVPSYSIVAGNPAIVKKRFNLENNEWDSI